MVRRVNDTTDKLSCKLLLRPLFPSLSDPRLRSSERDSSVSIATATTRGQSNLIKADGSSYALDLVKFDRMD